MSNIFLISDNHFGHANILNFKKPDHITPLRPFSTVEEMDEAMIERWNAVVKPGDDVYHLGDVVMNRKFLPIMAKLNGTKRLVMGNHDIFDISEYTPYFKRICGSRKLDNLLLTHIPVHVDSIAPWCFANVHGHIHAQDIDDGRYYNVSVENIDYTPIALEDLKIKIAEKKTKFIIE